jgi:hypothetical protein
MAADPVFNHHRMGEDENIREKLSLYRRFGGFGLLYSKKPIIRLDKSRRKAAMKRPGFLGLITIGFLALMFTVSSSWAQSGRRLHYSTLFNPGTVGTVSGEVVRVEHVPSGSGTDYCVHALLKTSKGQVTAILAPQAYMKEQGLTIAPKDRVTVTGSLITILGKPFILAMEVKGDRTMKLREASGRPAWAVGEDWHIH